MAEATALSSTPKRTKTIHINIKIKQDILCPPEFANVILKIWYGETEILT